MRTPEIPATAARDEQPVNQHAEPSADGAGTGGSRRLREHGAQLVDEVVKYEDVYRLCYVRGPEGILIGLAQQIG